MFECRSCGECCRGEMKVYLNPDDLVRIAYFLKYKNTKELFTNAIVIIDTEREGYPLPRIRFSKGFAGCCPFLVNLIDDKNKLRGICKLHPNKKPLVCSLAPLFRYIDFSNNTEDWGFKLPVKGCPGGSPGKPPFSAPEELKFLLGSEKEFFKRLSQRLDSSPNLNEICEEFYYHRID